MQRTFFLSNFPSGSPPTPGASEAQNNELLPASAMLSLWNSEFLLIVSLLPAAAPASNWRQRGDRPIHAKAEQLRLHCDGVFLDVGGLHGRQRHCQRPSLSGAHLHNLPCDTPAAGIVKQLSTRLDCWSLRRHDTRTEEVINQHSPLLNVVAGEIMPASSRLCRCIRLHWTCRT